MTNWVSTPQCQWWKGLTLALESVAFSFGLVDWFREHLLLFKWTGNAFYREGLRLIGGIRFALDSSPAGNLRGLQGSKVIVISLFFVLEHVENESKRTTWIIVDLLRASSATTNGLIVESPQWATHSVNCQVKSHIYCRPSRSLEWKPSTKSLVLVLWKTSVAPCAGLSGHHIRCSFFFVFAYHRSVGYFDPLSRKWSCGCQPRGSMTGDSELRTLKIRFGGLKAQIKMEKQANDQKWVSCAFQGVPRQKESSFNHAIVTVQVALSNFYFWKTSDTSSWAGRPG